MEPPGQRLKRARERLNLRFRDVEEASQKLAIAHGNSEFSIALSRLSDIENRGTVPSIFRLYSLCVIYRLDFVEVVGWYGLDLHHLSAESLKIRVLRTHLVHTKVPEHGEVSLPHFSEKIYDSEETKLLTPFIEEWGKFPLEMIATLETKKFKYGYIGAEDWAMYPILSPGALVQIDESKRKPQISGWTSEYDRPIYFLEHRDGYECCWCSLSRGVLSLHPHASSSLPARHFPFPSEIEIIGQVVGVVMKLGQGKQRHTRS